MNLVTSARRLTDENPPWLSRIIVRPEQDGSLSQYWCIRFGMYKMLAYFEAGSVPSELV